MKFGRGWIRSIFEVPIVYAEVAPRVQIDNVDAYIQEDITQVPWAKLKAQESLVSNADSKL
jgi:hypothetical protein